MNEPSQFWPGFLAIQESHRRMLIQLIERSVFQQSGPELQRVIDDPTTGVMLSDIARHMLDWLPEELRETPMEVKYDSKAKSLSYRILEEVGHGHQ